MSLGAPGLQNQPFTYHISSHLLIGTNFQHVDDNSLVSVVPVLGEELHNLLSITFCNAHGSRKGGESVFSSPGFGSFLTEMFLNSTLIMPINYIINALVLIGL